jgi:hypothetical protein
VIAEFHQHGGLFKTEVGGSAPSGVGLNGDEGLVGPRLHPPRATSRIDDNLLARTRAGDATGDCIHSFAATLGGRRNFSKLDAGAGRGLLRVATAEQEETENYRRRVAMGVSGEPFLEKQMWIAFHPNPLQRTMRQETRPMAKNNSESMILTG